MIYRPIEEQDFASMQLLDLELARSEVGQFAALQTREQAALLRTSLPALRFYARSEHSFVACQDANEAKELGAEIATVHGFVLAQSVWMGDKPIVWISCVRIHLDAPEGCLPGLLHAVVKSAYDAAVYEIHLFTAEREMAQAAGREGFQETQQKKFIRKLGSKGAG